MIAEPWFWREDTYAARAAALALTPAAALYAALQRTRRKLTKPLRVDAPVVCVGATSLGGAGKTPTAIALAGLLSDRYSPIILTRGFGGRLTGPLLVDLDRHNAADVGDEALLLARTAPTVVAKSKTAGASFAADAGAELIIMDDGHQNPTIEKDFTLLIAKAPDVTAKRTFPAGPLRETFVEGLRRADAVGFRGDQEPADFGKPTFRLSFELEKEDLPTQAVAFCGIADPKLFYRMLAGAGVELIDAVAFPDHAPLTDKQIKALREKAGDAPLVTTEKDFVRLSDEAREGVVVARAAMRIDQPDALRTLILEKIEKRTN